MSLNKRRKSTLAGVLVFLVLLLSAFGAKGQHGNSSGSAAGSGGPSPSGSPHFDRKMLRKEFQIAQEKELHQFELKEKNEADLMKASQRNRQADFDRNARTDRQKFFADPHPGTEKRKYIQALLARRDTMLQQIASERTKYQAEAEGRLDALLDEQHKKREEFEDALEKGTRPGDNLWPQPGIMSEPSPIFKVQGK